MATISTPARSALILKVCLNVAPLVLCLLGIYVLLHGLTELQAQPTPRPTAQNQTSSPPAADIGALQEQLKTLSNQLEDLSKSREVLRDRLDTVSQQASHVQWLLSIVLGVAGLLTLAQGLFGFFSAQNYVKQAEDAIRRANDGVKEMDSLAADVRSKFPMFADIETARAEAFNELSKLTSVLDRDYENLYANSEWLTRQKILAIESFSAMQFLTAIGRNKELTRNLQLLGKFYGGKFATDAGLATDFERARYYFDLALQKSDRDYSVLNDSGWLFALVAKPPQRGKARQLFEESLESKPNQQRALYNLGTLCWEKGNREKLKEGIKYFSDAEKQANWEELPNPGMAAHIQYNLACFYDALAAGELDLGARIQLLDKCCEHLLRAATLGRQPAKLVESDLNPGGDLETLAASDKHEAQRKDIVAKYKEAWSTR